MSSAGNWISPQLAVDLLAEGTNAFRIASGHGFWIERFGDTALISLRPGPDAKTLAAAIAQTGWNPKRVFVRHRVRNPGEKDTPILLIGDAQSSPLETVSVDISKSSLQRGRRNFELNRIPAYGHRFIPEDVPTFLRRLIKRGETFDAIILDPPTFGRSGASKTFRFERDFPTLLECAHQLSAPGGAILLSTNFTAWDEAALIECARGILPSKTKFHKIPAPPEFFGNAPSATVWALL